MTLACLASQNRTELGLAQPRLVYIIFATIFPDIATRLEFCEKKSLRCEVQKTNTIQHDQSKTNKKGAVLSFFSHFEPFLVTQI